MFGPSLETSGAALRSDANSDHEPGRLGLLASALSHRALRVARGEAGAPSWTDGKAVFVEVGERAPDPISALSVQAALLAAGSLAPEVLRRLARRPALARRYLAVEGHRALAAIQDLLPRRAHALLDPAVAERSDSPAASLAAARSREPIADPPRSFGTLRARALLASLDRAARAQRAVPPPARTAAGRVLAELAEDEEDDGTATDAFASPVGGGGALGRLLGRMLAPVRQLRGGGPPGADAPTHRTRAATRGRGTVVATGRAEAAEEATPDGPGIRYPEWDVHRRRYRPDWCTVSEVDPEAKDDAPVMVPGGLGLHRPLARLGLGLDRHRRQAQGDDLDIDAAIEARVETLAGSAPDEAVYLASLRRRRDLSVLLLLDVSGSTAEPAEGGRTVHEQQRAVAGALARTLHEVGDRVALYAFHSQGRSAVHLVPVKGFEEDLDSRVARRLHSLAPVAYSRLGAAIRHGARVLEERGGTSRRLLVVLSDGLAYDHGYEPVYGAADARRALAEARRRGVGCLCLSVGAGTDVEVLRRVFGSAAHAALPRPEQVGRVIGPLFRSALRSAEVRRRASGRANGSGRRSRHGRA
jgi:hypothetical protein